MSKLPELDASHINTAGALIVVASNAGVFKLAQFEQVAVAYNESRRIVEASKKEGFKMEDEPVNSLVLIHNAVEFAANNNGFKIVDYDTVVKIVAIFAAYLKPHLEKKEEGGVEESKE
jgi:hypothetical protein